MGVGYYWCNLDKWERIMPTIDGQWIGYKRGEWTSCRQFFHDVVDYIQSNWNGDHIGVYSEDWIYDQEQAKGKDFTRVYADGVPNIGLEKREART